MTPNLSYEEQYKHLFSLTKMLVEIFLDVIPLLKRRIFVKRIVNDLTCIALKLEFTTIHYAKYWMRTFLIIQSLSVMFLGHIVFLRPTFNDDAQLKMTIYIYNLQ